MKETVLKIISKLALFSPNLYGVFRLSVLYKGGGGGGGGSTPGLTPTLDFRQFRQNLV